MTFSKPQIEVEYVENLIDFQGSEFRQENILEGMRKLNKMNSDAMKRKAKIHLHGNKEQ